MKLSLSLALFVVVACIASSHALPAKKRMVYYQQPAQWYSSPQRMMYVQYVQPSRTHARSTQAASALVAGETVATGTYLQDCDHAEADVAAAGPSVLDVEGQQTRTGEDVLAAAGAHGAHSVAEAYPEDNVPQIQVEIESSADEAAAADVEIAKNDDAAKVPREYNFEANDAEAPGAPAVDVATAADLPAPVPIAPVATPAKRYLPAKKKVYVELEHSAEAETDEAVEDENENAVAVAQDEEQEEDDETDVAPAAPKNPARSPNARRPAVKKPTTPAKAAPGGKPSKPSKPLPAGTFFPIDFGGTSGGAIAIANSFSTGEGGSATSHAIAYGSPDAARARARPSKFH